MTFLSEYVSPIGVLTLASDGERLTGLWLEGQKYFGATLEAGARNGDPPVLARVKDWLARYFAGERPDMTLPILPHGSSFRISVWNRLLEIPYGGVVSYRDIARDLGSSPRAVGGAVGHNPISIIIPCHRVVGAGGALTGYAGGVDRKTWLLTLEGARLPICA